MKLTVSNLRDIYSMLRGMSPFVAYKLPDADEIEFKLNRSSMLMGSYEPDPDTITISRTICTTYPLVIETMGHEMVHLALERKGEETHANHGAQFLILAEKVCTEFGWKLEDF